MRRAFLYNGQLPTYGEDRAIAKLFSRNILITDAYCSGITSWLDKLGEDALKKVHILER